LFWIVLYAAIVCIGKLCLIPTWFVENLIIGSWLSLLISIIWNRWMNWVYIWYRKKWIPQTDWLDRLFTKFSFNNTFLIMQNSNCLCLRRYWAKNVSVILHEMVGPIAPLCMTFLFFICNLRLLISYYQNWTSAIGAGHFHHVRLFTQKEIS
jgi:hypothetical protein